MNESKPLSRDNPDYIEQYRYLELKNFCLQYNHWKKKINNLNYYQTMDYANTVKASEHANRTEQLALIRKHYAENIDLVNRCCKMVDHGDYILKAVTEKLTYDKIRAREYIPCSQIEFYKNRRRFFFLLDQFRN